MRNILIFGTLACVGGAAQAQTAPPPCPAGQTECMPWERYGNAKQVAKPNPFDQFDPKPIRLGPGPHTLIISDENQLTRMDYKSGQACQKARDVIRSQFGTMVRLEGGGLFVPKGVKTFCVPR